MTCNHDLPFLMGTADGIVCRACGRLFRNFDEIKKADAPEEKKPGKKPRKKKEDTGNVA